MRYKQRNDYDGFEVPSGTVHRIACCDCNLVHDFVFVSEDGKPIGIAARRNNRATAQRRRVSQTGLSKELGVGPSQSDHINTIINTAWGEAKKP